MRKTLLTALAAVALLSGGALLNRAGAMPIATPSATARHDRKYRTR